MNLQSSYASPREMITSDRLLDNSMSYFPWCVVYSHS